jgi:hypothetical protein
MTDDMVGEGLATSMARPGGHTTGISILGAELILSAWNCFMNSSLKRIASQF